MGKYNVSIPNLLGGVSKQSPSIRAENQLEESINCICDPVTGLRRRHSSEYVATLANGGYLTRNAAIHAVNRENVENYAIAIDGGIINVYNLDTGVKGEIVDATPDAMSYIKAANSKKSLRFTSVNDFTFIMNTEIVPRALPMRYKDNDVFKCEVDFLDTATGFRLGLRLKRQVSIYMLGTLTSSLADFDAGGGTYKTAIYKYFTSYTALKKYIYDTYLPSFGLGAMYERSPAEFNEGEEYVSITVPNLYAGSQTAPSYAQIETYTGYWNVADNSLAGHYSTPITNVKRDLTGGSAFYMSFRFSPSPNSTAVYTLLGSDNIDSPGTHFDMFLVAVGGSSTVYPGGDPATVLYKGYPYAEGFEALQTELTDYYITINGVKFYDNVGLTPNQKAAYFRDLINAHPTIGTQVVASVIVRDGKNILAVQNNSTYDLKLTVDRKGFADVKYVLDAPLEKVYIIIKQGVADQLYQVSINGHHAFYATGTTDQPATWRTNAVAAGLKAKIDTWGVGYACEQFGNLLRVTVPALPDGAPTTFDYVDTWNSQAMYVTKSNFASTADLPFRFIEGVPLQVGKQSDGYYLQYVRSKLDTGRVKGSLDYQVKLLPDNVRMGHLFPSILSTVSHTDLAWTAVEADRQGVWEECAKPYLVSSIDPATMPHVLISLGNNKYELRPAVWTSRKVGDSESSPLPSFIDKSVQDIFFFKNRLGILTEDTVVLSQVGSYFDFFVDTVKEVLDDGPIDIQITSEDASTLLRAVPFANSVLIFSDKSQFRLASNDVFTPNSAAVAPAGKYSFNDKLGVLSAGNSLFFSGIKGNSLQMWQMANTGDAGLISTNISLHVDGYIPLNANFATVTSDNRMLLVGTQGSSDLYLYQWLTGQGNEAQQSSWVKWELGGVQRPKEILFGRFHKSTLWLITLSSAVGLPQLVRIQSDDSLKDNQLNYATAMDFKVFAKNSSSVVVPLDIVGDSSLTFVNTATGLAVTPVGSVGNSYTMPATGDYVAGLSFRSVATLSTYYAKDKNGNSDVDAYITIQTAITTQHGEGTKHKLRIKYKSGEADKVAKSNEDTRKTTRSLVQARNINNTVIIENDGVHPFFIQAINYEIDVKVRTYRA